LARRALLGTVGLLVACSSDFPPFPDRGTTDASGDTSAPREGGDVSVDGPSAPRDSDTVDSNAGDTARSDAPVDDAPPDGAGPADRQVNDADARDASTADADARLVCEGGATILACGTSCIDVSSSAQNCRACGHDCGQGSSCQAGVCQPVILYSPPSLPTLEVDASGIYFRVTDGVDTCPLTGCTLTPTRVAPGGSPLLLANGYVTASSPLIPVGENYFACPESGCTSTNQIGLISANRQVTVYGIIASPSGFFYAFNGPPGSILARCMMPSAAGCGSQGAVAMVKTTPLVASDTFIYFLATLGDSASDSLYSCPTDATNCTPTPMNTGYSKLSAYGNDLYILFPVGGPMQTIAKCPGTGCPGGGAPPVITTTYGMLDIAVDASGIYWTRAGSIQACRLTGCVGGPVDVALNQGMPGNLRLSGGFVYWVDASDNTIRRVAKPVL
jgi:hypothetical protein